MPTKLVSLEMLKTKKEISSFEIVIFCKYMKT
jgi:hypothetical protein